MVSPLHLKNIVLLIWWWRGCFTADLPTGRTTVTTNFLTILSIIALKHDVYPNIIMVNSLLECCVDIPIYYVVHSSKILMMRGISRGVGSIEKLVDHTRDSLVEFARTIHWCFKNEWSSADSCVSQRFMAKTVDLKFPGSGRDLESQYIGRRWRTRQTWNDIISRSYSRQAVNSLCKTIKSVCYGLITIHIHDKPRGSIP